MTSKLDDISEAIGGLRAEVKNLSRQMVDSNRRADQHRAAIHRRVDDLVEEVSDLKSDVTGVTGSVSGLRADVIDAKAVTDKVKMWEQRGVGALFVTGIASAAVSSTFVGFLVYWWESIMRLLRSN